MRRSEHTIIEVSDSNQHDFISVGQADEWVEITVGETCRCDLGCQHKGTEASTLVHLDDLKVLISVLSDRIATIEAEDAA